MELRNRQRAVTRAVAVLVVLIHSALVGFLAVSLAPTCDEYSHLAAGLRRLSCGKFDLDLGNPPLVGTVAALPLLFVDVAMDWRSSPTSAAVGRDFAMANGARYFALLSAARLACLPFTILGACVCFRWSYRLYGPLSGVAALALWCFDPNILAHASLVTGDLAATATGLAAFYSFWKWLKQPSATGALLCGCWLGAAQLTKYVWVVAYFAWPMLWAAWRLCQAPDGPTSRRRYEAASLSLILLTSICIINFGYLFEGSLRRLDEYGFGVRVLKVVGVPEDRAQRGPLGRCVAAAPLPLPAPYLRGMEEVHDWFGLSHQSYLRGRWSPDGWWYYYLYGLAIKVPLGTWLLLLLSFSAGLRRGRTCVAGRDSTFVLLSAALVILFVTAVSTQQSHVRYVLPALPFLFIFASKSATCFAGRRHAGPALTAVGLCWATTSSMIVYPHSLSYFNGLVGGPGNGHAHLIDSNIDWGQDLFELRDWLAKHPDARPFHLAYFGGIDPRLAGIKFSVVPVAAPAVNPRPRRDGVALSAGWYAVSVNLLHGLPFVIPDGAGGWRPTRGEYEYLRRHHPVGQAGYSIYIYRIGM